MAREIEDKSPFVPIVLTEKQAYATLAALKSVFASAQMFGPADPEAREMVKPIAGAMVRMAEALDKARTGREETTDLSVIERWYYCPGCERIGPMSDFQDECRPGWTHGALCCVDRESPALAVARGAVEALRALHDAAEDYAPPLAATSAHAERWRDAMRRADAIIGGQ